MRSKTICMAVLFLVASASTAAAQPAPAWDVSLALPGLETGTLAVDVERDLPAKQLSLVGGLGVRSAASGDFSSTTTSAGVEVRHWLKRRALWSAQPRGAMIGWYLGGRLDATAVRLSDDVMDTTSDTLVLAASALVGYRFAPWRGLTITPHMGITWRTELDLEGRLPAARQGGLTFGLNTGWMF